jgi:hypothetical protein
MAQTADSAAISSNQHWQISPFATGVALPHFNHFQSFSHHPWHDVQPIGTKKYQLEKSKTDFDWPDSEDDKLENKQRTLEAVK